ncbi:cytochrome c [Flavobacterium sp.]|uniref:c-type cytochrome n=1 Tax=Flavobacterium sp. TaxID=239 RepID=UPI002630E1E9|nr:cytochrome c [Flavobacterium sp.]MDD3004106.1 cytochrome c [Flavobacterium sp.]
MAASQKYLIVLTLLASLFLAYNVVIYTSKDDYGTVHLSKKALQGETLWLKNNCNACHQFYGLGGYLGPDLTNIYSIREESYIKAMLNSGIKAMPKFSFDESEKEALIQFLKEVNQTGYYPNKEANIEYNGWVEIKKKQYEHK